MVNKGKVVGAIPKVTRIGRSKYDWDTPARLAKMSGQPVLAGEHIRNSLVKSLRQYDRPPFVTDEGHIEINLRNSSIDEQGVRHGDVYMQWVPNQKEEK